MSWFTRRGRSPEDRFADEVASLARSMLGARVKHLPSFALEVDAGGGGPRTMFLDNVYRETMHLEGEERADRLRRAVLGLTAPPPPTTWADAAPRLRPALRAMSWTATSPGLPANRLARSRLVPFVSLLAAVDSEHAMGFVTESDLMAWGVSEEQVLERARENLAACTLPVQVGESLAQVVGPDGYVSSWLALPDVLAKVAHDVGGTVVAVAPSRDTLLLLDVDRHETACEVLGTVLEEYLESPRGVSPVPYVLSGGGLRAWDPPAGHPAAAVVDRAVHVLAATEYLAQRTTLEALFEKAGEDVFVAKHTLMEGRNGAVWSWGTWARQVTAGFLPQTDFVFLGDHVTKDQMWVRWDDVMRLAGSALEATGYDPPLWRYGGWPDDATVAALRAVATEPPFAD